MTPEYKYFDLIVLILCNSLKYLTLRKIIDSMKSNFLLFICLLLTLTLSAQNNAMLTNAQPIKENRYDGVKGDPYLFDEWQYGKTINSSSEVLDSVLMNYNGYSHNIEVRKGERFIELDERHYPLLVIYGEDGKEIYFKRSPTKTLFNRYPRVIYNGDYINAVEDFTAKIETITINDVGAIRENKRFKKKKLYYLIQDNKTKIFKLKKKSILKILSHKKELEAFIKKNKLKLNSEEGLIKLLEYYESQGFSEG